MRIIKSNCFQQVQGKLERNREVTLIIEIVGLCTYNNKSEKEKTSPFSLIFSGPHTNVMYVHIYKDLYVDTYKFIFGESKHCLGMHSEEYSVKIGLLCNCIFRQCQIGLERVRRWGE